MTVAPDVHDDYGANFEERGARRLVAEYGRPGTAHQAVRNGVGVIEAGHGVVVVEGDDRVEFVDNTITNRVPGTDGEGRYALLLDPQGRVETDMYVYNAGERLLVFVPPGRAGPLAEDWAGKVFIQDVEIREATGEFGIFGVHGPDATEKVASVLTGAAAPDSALSFVRGSIADAGVTVVATDAPAGEESHEVVCGADAAPEVLDALLNQGVSAIPFGRRTWETLTAEAGTPLFETELDGQIPNVLGLGNAVDFDKGCFVGQEVVSKVANRGRPSKRLVGLRPEMRPETGAAVFAGDGAAGEVTRAVESPVLDQPIALALVSFDLEDAALTARVDGEEITAPVVDLPFVEGSARSARLPRYEG